MPEPLAPGAVTIAVRRLHPLSPLVGGGVALLRSWPIVIIAAARSSWLLVAGLGLALVAWRTVDWLRTTWALDADGLVVRSGLFQRSVQTIPPQRVQQVEVRRGLMHRALGLAAVRVGLAGAGASSQVDLDALSVVDAERLHAVLERWRTGSVVAPGDPLPPPTLDPTPPVVPVALFAVETRHLVIAGLTSRSLWLAPIAAVAGLFQLLGDLRLDDDATGAVRSRLGDAAPALTIALVMVLAVVAAVVSTIVTNHGLTMTRVGDDLTVRRGLIEQRSVAVPRRRIQFVRLATNVVRDRAGLASLDASTADLGAANEDSTSVSLPIGPRDRFEELVVELLPGADPAVPTHRHPPAAIRREIVRRSLAVVPLGVGGLLVGGIGALLAGVVLGVGFAVSTGWIAGRRRRSGWSDTTVVAEWGVVGWQRVVVPVDRVQSVATVASPTQRRSGLVTLRLDLAGSRTGVELRDLAGDDALSIVSVIDAQARRR